MSGPVSRPLRSGSKVSRCGPRVRSRTNPRQLDSNPLCSMTWIVLSDNQMHILCYEEHTSQGRHRHRGCRNIPNGLSISTRTMADVLYPLQHLLLRRNTLHGFAVSGWFSCVVMAVTYLECIATPSPRQVPGLYGVISPFLSSILV